jgi:hypothetical protein
VHTLLLFVALLGKGIAPPDDTPTLQALINNTPVGGIATLPGKPLYLNTVLLMNRENITLRGQPGTVLLSPNATAIRLGSVTDVQFESLTVISTSTATDEGVYGLVYSLNERSGSIRFMNCYFSAPNTPTNAIKFVTDTPGSIVSDVRFEGCEFASIGRMGIEFQNHTFDGVIRFQDITVNHCQFRDTGLIRARSGGHYGMAVSFSGRGQACSTVDCTIENPYDIGIEYTGGIDRGRIVGNVFGRCQRANTEAGRPLSLISYVGGEHVLIKNNRSGPTSTTGKTACYLADLTNAKVTRNTLALGTYLNATRCRESKFKRNQITTNGEYVAYFNDSEHNKLVGNQLIAQSPGLYSAIRFDGSKATSNIVRGGFIRHRSGDGFGEVRGAGKNKVSRRLIPNQQPR